MGEIADSIIGQYESGRRGMPCQKSAPNYPKATKDAIANAPHHVVIVLGGVGGPLPEGVRTNRLPDTLLIVTDADENSYWVNTSNGVTGIGKSCCKALTGGMSLAAARARREELEKEVKLARKAGKNPSERSRFKPA